VKDGSYLRKDAWKKSKKGSGAEKAEGRPALTVLEREPPGGFIQGGK